MEEPHTYNKRMIESCLYVSSDVERIVDKIQEQAHSWRFLMNNWEQFLHCLIILQDAEVRVRRAFSEGRISEQEKELAIGILSPSIAKLKELKGQCKKKIIEQLEWISEREDSSPSGWGGEKDRAKRGLPYSWRRERENGPSYLTGNRTEEREKG